MGPVLKVQAVAGQKRGDGSGRAVARRSGPWGNPRGSGVFPALGNRLVQRADRFLMPPIAR